ncbi:hypothetical protein Nepgr_003890 [Nepenthes gracilis]|uniref:Uncharacterized protein n=1 Tax=Nepenthes gracilis TaxID=150966 RepID=A0AAD3S0C5_NEPGR|nr:hypothetical protein Nepgr_003890 [Nepenthes gracilis]
MAVPFDERPSIHGNVDATAGGHMQDEHMLLSKRSSLKENGEWLLADGYNAAPYADISTAGVLGDEVAAAGLNMRDEHMMLPSSACNFNTNVQDDTLDTMALDLLDAKVAEDISCQTLLSSRILEMLMCSMPLPRRGWPTEVLEVLMI